MSFPSNPVRILRRLAPIIGVLSIAVALAGCSAVKLGYETLPQWTDWWLHGYADFDEGPRQLVREDIRRLHDWHRAHELPRYAHLLQRLEAMAAGEISAEQACALEPELRERLQALRVQAEPALAAHARTLKPAQLERLERRFARNNREYGRQWVRLEPAERIDKRARELAERAEVLYGPLEDRQRELLRRQLADSPYSPAAVLAERRARQHDTLAALRRIASQAVPQEEARAVVHALLERALRPPDPAYRQYLEAMRQDSCRLVATVHNSTSVAQREVAVRRLRGWQRDLLDLAAPR
jgi:hypothetical protein